MGRQLGARFLVTEDEPGNGVEELLGRVSDVGGDGLCLAVIISHLTTAQP
ncbi:hypothetical protein [Streptomyces ossamyceticus]|uniref:Uncharacterized protein n=1 Tax=Streptomyces ossamyceticus TaxID=249581 RepID=A0ABV2V1V0_9ACTN